MTYTESLTDILMKGKAEKWGAMPARKIYTSVSETPKNHHYLFTG